MALSVELVKSFSKVINDQNGEGEKSSPFLLYGTVQKDASETYVIFDGSSEKTPFNTLADVASGDRVACSIEDHKVTIVGNLTHPASAGVNVDSIKSYAEDSDGNPIFFLNLVDGKVTIKNADIPDLTSAQATIANLQATKLDASELTAVNANITSLQANKMDTTLANIDTANINTAKLNTLFSGEIEGFEIHGDVITSNTLSVKDLILTGEDGLIKQINILGGDLTVTELTKEEYEQKVHGSVLVAKSVTAGHISTTSLDALSANMGTLTAGKIQSSDYKHTSGHYTDTGMIIDLNNNIIRSPYFACGPNFAYFKGTLATNIVTSDSINSNAITTDKINASAITSAKISSNAVTSDKISSNAITSAKISSNAVTSDKISVTSLSAINANMGTITTGLMTSTNYKYTSGEYADSGLKIDLTNSDIRSKYFHLGSSGVHIKGTLAAESKLGSWSIDSEGSLRYNHMTNNANDWTAKLKYNGLYFERGEDSYSSTDSLAEYTRTGLKFKNGAVTNTFNEPSTLEMNALSIYLRRGNQKLALAMSSGNDMDDFPTAGIFSQTLGKWLFSNPCGEDRVNIPVENVYVNGNVKSFGTNTLVAVQTVTCSQITISGNGTATASGKLDTTNYSYLTIIKGISNSSNGMVYSYGWNNNTNNVSIGIKNLSSSSITITPTITVLVRRK